MENHGLGSLWSIEWGHRPALAAPPSVPDTPCWLHRSLTTGCRTGRCAPWNSRTPNRALAEIPPREGHRTTWRKLRQDAVEPRDGARPCLYRTIRDAGGAGRAASDRCPKERHEIVCQASRG